MVYANRKLLNIIKKSKTSVLLLGPRQVGKSTLMSHLASDLSFNLADEAVYFQFAKNPNELRERVEGLPAPPKRLLIDEIQRLPSLLNTVQVLIDESKGAIQFLLTGSSARKLRRGGANLLPGRVHTYRLGPLAPCELPHMNLAQVLSTGLLPGIYFEPSVRERQKTLRSYSAVYLKEEIQAEALTRDVEGFARFLEVAAVHSSLFLDISKLSSEVGINRETARRLPSHIV